MSHYHVHCSIIPISQGVCVCAKSLQSCPTLCDPVTAACQTPLSVGFSRENIGVGCRDLLQGIFLTQGSNSCLLCLLHWQVSSLITNTSWEAHHILPRLYKITPNWIFAFQPCLLYKNQVNLLFTYKLYSNRVRL